MTAVELFGNRIRLHGDFDAWSDTPKSLGGAWNVRNGYWSFPKSMEVCRSLRDAFGVALEIGPRLWGWATQEAVRERDLNSIAKQDMTRPAELPRVREQAPTMWTALQEKGYQTVAVEFGQRARFYINADQQGLGKCIESLGAIIEGGVTGRVLVIAQTTPIVATWIPEVEKWLDDYDGSWGIWTPGFKLTRNGALRPATRDERDEEIEHFLKNEMEHDLAFCMINPEMLRSKVQYECKLDACEGASLNRSKCVYMGPNHKRTVDHRFPTLFETDWDAMIADEVHRFALRSNPRSRKPSQTGLGWSSLRSTANHIRIALTGTPMKGKPKNMWPIMSWLRPDVYTSQWKWMASRLETKSNRYAYGGVEYLDVIRKDAREAYDRELESVMIRRTKPELHKLNPAWAPPPKQYITVPLRMGEKQMSQYQTFESEGAVKLASGRVASTGVLAQIRRMSQFAISSWDYVDDVLVPRLPSCKFDWLIDDLFPSLGIDSEGDTPHKVVISSQYTKLVNMLQVELLARDILCMKLIGETGLSERREMIEAWQGNAPHRVFLMNTATGGTSITLDSADHLVVFDETWVPDDTEQVEDRVHRTSRIDHQVTIYVPRVVGTVEETVIGPTNAFKSENNFQYLDAKRVRAWAKERVQNG